jgi:glucose/arabinose dehydrogenase
MDEGGFTSDGDVNRVTRTATTAEPPDEGHGSWDRTVLNGYKIIYVPFESGRPAGPAEDVVTAFLIDGAKAQGRPVGLAVDGEGGLLIADDTGNSVWRVSAASR